MASRILHGSRAPKHRPGDQDSGDRPTGLPRRAPAPAATVPSSSSKIPKQPSSLFSRSRTTKPEPRAAAAAAQPSATRTRAADGVPKAAIAQSSLSMNKPPSTVARGLEHGMGVRTEVSGAPAPSPPRNRLRRKIPAQDPRGNYAQSEASASSHDMRPTAPAHPAQPYQAATGESDPFPNSVLGITLPPAPSSLYTGAVGADQPTEFATSMSRMDAFNTRNPHHGSTHELPPPPGISFPEASSNASTRTLESPGPFSRTSTPTSASSFSPSAHHTPKFAPRVRPAPSPINSRPPVTRRKAAPVSRAEESAESQGLAAVRESITSSSSSSTVKGTEPPAETAEPLRPGRKHGPDAVAPAAPLRVSSRKLQKPPASDSHVQAPDRQLPGPSPRPLQTPTHPLEYQGRASKLPALNTQMSQRPPQRPSREGTPRLEGHHPPPVIQSNLTHLATTGHKRRESIEKAMAGSSSESVALKSAIPASTTRTSSLRTNATGLTTRLPTAPGVSRSNNSSNVSLNTMERNHAVSSKEENIRDEAPRRIPTPVTASPSKMSGRFGLFSKKSKPGEQPTSAPAVDRLPRKGPAAGTGHEGYGKYARRGRSSSTSTAASRTRSTSTDRNSVGLVRPSGSRKGSFTSTTGSADGGRPALDDFYRERLEPVVIGGGGRIRENRNSGSTSLYRTASGQSSVTSMDSGSYSVTAPSLARVSMEEEHAPARSLLPAPNIDGLASDPARDPQPTLAHRRSMHRSQLLGEPQAPRIPPPIKTRALAPSPVLETYDSTVSSAPRTGNSYLTDDFSEGHEGAWLRPKHKKTPEKGRLHRKWNFFRRPSQSPGASSFDRKDSFGNTSELSVAASQHQEPTGVGHYAMIDDMEPEDDGNLDARLREIESNLELEEEDAGPDPFDAPSEPRHPSMLLPSPPTYPAEFSSAPRRADSPKVMLNFDALPSLPPKARSRLPQVGRIPQVVPKARRDRVHNPSPQSFSRPFVPRTSLDEQTVSTASSTLVERPVLAVETEPLKQAAWAAASLSAKAVSAPGAAATNGMLYGLDGEREFITFSPRQMSVVSGSGSSGAASLAPITAVTPLPDSALSEDEVWNEYDELLDRVASPATFSSADAMQPAHEGQDANDGLQRPPQGQVLSPDNHGRRKAMQHASANTSLPAVSTRSDSLRVPDESQQLASPVSLSNVYANYGNRTSQEKSPIRESISSVISGSVYSSQTVFSDSGSRSSTGSTMPERITKAMADKVSNTADETLRFSALLTSRWLSFDRVLFSPVQAELRANRQDRVLVVDGLENDDWSCYCALTYPDATFYNLSAAPVASWLLNQPDKTAKWSPPSNHRRISHTSISAPFPFPKGFFTAAVLRFPAASPLAAYRNLVSECKRVLRPGGYLELSVLDMDLVNAGPRARRALRALKERTQAREPDTSLSPASDSLTRLLGRRGFDNLHSCVVGVPVAGVLSDSRANSIDGSGGDGGRPAAPPGPERQQPSSSPQQQQQQQHARQASRQPTLSMLLSDQTGGGGGGAAAQYPLARMVARVGRWWWTRCYEAGALARGEASLWADGALLAECEAAETGLRLLVAYAQKPVSVRRRTVSV